MPYTENGTWYEWNGSDGPIVVLIHGFGMVGDMWQWQVPELSKNYRVLTYDLLGHGRSPAPQSRPSLTLFSEQLKELLDDQGIYSCSIFGFSLGGMIVRRFAMDCPQRVDSIGILFSPHKRDTDAQAAIDARVLQAEQEGPSSTVDAALARWFSKGYLEAHPEIAEQVREWILANDPRVYAGIYSVLANGVAELVAPVPPISCPTLVMTGEEDFGNSPAMTQAIANEIVGSKAVILPGLRHMGMVEGASLFNAEMNMFLTKALSGR